MIGEVVACWCPATPSPRQQPSASLTEVMNQQPVASRSPTPYRDRNGGSLCRDHCESQYWVPIPAPRVPNILHQFILATSPALTPLRPVLPSPLPPEFGDTARNGSSQGLWSHTDLTWVKPDRLRSYSSSGWLWASHLPSLNLFSHL